MAAIFCFTDEFKVTGGTYTFNSTDGENYIVTCNYTDDYCEMALTWTHVGTKFIDVTYYYTINLQKLGNKIQYVKDKTGASFRIFIGRNRIQLNFQLIFVIRVIPIVPSAQYTNDKPCGATSYDTIKTATKNEPVTEEKLKQLSKDFKDLLQTGTLSDVVLTDGSNEICAHKVILSVRSPVFAKMFLHPLKENLENRITIKDITIDVLRELLHFMYTGTVTIKDSTMARNLYVAADKYDVKELRDICSLMLKSVDLNNVFDTLLLADLYSDKKLKEYVLNFIATNYAQLETLPNWNSFMKENQSLAIEILSFVIGKKK